MDSIFQALGALQGGNAVSELGRALGADDQTAGNALSAALPVLIGALSRNAARPDGAASLESALRRDHDGSILDDLAGALASGSVGNGNGNGDGILGHLLGDRRDSVESQLGRSTGLDSASIGKLLTTLAPVVLGALGRSRKERGLDAGGLAKALGEERDRAEAAAPGGTSVFERLLDADGDGDIGDDVAQMGAKLLGGLFGGSR